MAESEVGYSWTSHIITQCCLLKERALCGCVAFDGLGRDSWCGTPTVGRNKRPSLESDAIRSYKRLVKHSGQL